MHNQRSEITLRSIIIAAILAMLLAATNAYLGLKVGITVSASIPAAVLAMGLLRYCKNSNILEINIVQTGASAGEALISGIMFVLPALLIVGYWQQFSYWETLIIALIGGILGTLFSVPLRRVLLADPSLRFPEGTAIGQVLKVSQAGDGRLRELAQGGIVGSLIGLCQSGFQVVGQQLSLWFSAGGAAVYGIALGFEPALLAAGYIVGIEVALSMLCGVAITSVGVSILSYSQSVIMTDTTAQAMAIWQSQLRPIGIGVMLVGGIGTVIRLFKPIIAGLQTSLASLQITHQQGYQALAITERDIPIHYTAMGIACGLLPAGWLLWHFLQHPALTMTFSLQIVTLITALLLILVAGFFLAALGGYFAGLLGGSNSPISSVSLLSLLLTSLLLTFLWRGVPSLTHNAHHFLAAQGFAIILGTIITTVSAITNNTIQDLKAGQIIGATPWKQQVILLLGVGVSSIIIAPILFLLYNAYGMGGVFPRPGMDPTHALAAPQAVLMATLVKGAFTDQLPWSLMGIGCFIGLVFMAIDHRLKKNGLGLPVLAVGSGIYLPMTATTAVILGGLLAYIADRRLRRQQPSFQPKEVSQRKQRGLTIACGLVAGSSLMGVVLAIPFTVMQSTDALKLALSKNVGLVSSLGLLSTATVLCWIYTVINKQARL